jgi:hypothetical protein
VKSSYGKYFLENMIVDLECRKALIDGVSKWLKQFADQKASKSKSQQA